MEWNAKSPTQWDWENLIMVNATTGNLKKSRAADWEIDGAEKRFSSWSFNSSGDGICNDSGGSGSGTGHASLSKSSQSASINFSSTGEVKTSKFTSETVAEDLNNEKELVKSRPTGGSRKLEASGEPLLGLKLGKRTYFGDVCAGSNAKTHPFSATPASSVIPAKRSKSSSQAMNVPRCQVEGCNIDLSMAKDYHRKHRICESHSKCSMVIVAGVERRFCQQCSRFHGLSEFDEKKRSCRRRLSDHNARRRKPQPGSFQLNPARLSSSLRDERGQMNFVWNRTPLVHSSPNASFVWESTPNSTFTITKEYVKPGKNEVVDEQLHLPGNQITNSVPMLYSNSNGSLLSKRKSTAAEVLNQAFEEPVVISSNMDATPDLHRALSLLSTNRWGSYKPNSVSLQHPLHRYHTSTPQSVLHTIPQGSALASSEYQRTEQQSANDTQMHNLTSHSEGSSYFQEF